MNDYQKFLRQRKILIAAIIFCVAIIVFGSGYIVLKLDPEFSILPGIPEIIVDHGDEIGGTTKPEPDDETEPHTEPTDPDNTSEPATPETPSTPETPATPETPSTPVTPPTTPNYAHYADHADYANYTDRAGPRTDPSRDQRHLSTTNPEQIQTHN